MSFLPGIVTTTESALMKKTWGKAKIEVLALRNDILDLLNQGFSKHDIYRRFKSEQKLTLGFRTFSRHAKKISEDAALSVASIRTTSVASTIPPLQKRTPTPTGVRRKFTFDQSHNIDELLKSSDDT